MQVPRKATELTRLAERVHRANRAGLAVPEETAELLIGLYGFDAVNAAILHMNKGGAITERTLRMLREAMEDIDRLRGGGPLATWGADDVLEVA